MEPAEFKRILDLGLGRAILYLQKHDSTPHRDAILHACLHNTAYDAQLEGSRLDYLLEIISLTHEEAFYRDHILAAVPVSGGRDIDQFCDFAVHFAEQGDESARSALYKQIAANIDSGYFGGEPIIQLDGMQGLLFAAEETGKVILSKRQFPGWFSPFWYPDNWIENEEEWDDEAKEHWSALNQAAAINPQIRAYVDAVRESLSDRPPSEKRKRIDPTKVKYEQLKEWLADPLKIDRPPLSWTAWGLRASDDDIQHAASDLLTLSEEDADRLIAYLRLFCNREFPLEPDKLIEWASCIDYRQLQEATIAPAARVPLYALDALEMITHPDVRQLAITMIETGNHAGWAVALLAMNYIEGDWSLVEEITRRPLDRDDYHALGFSVGDVFEARPSKEAVPSLLNLYEYEPCSHCRRRIVEYLHDINSIPDWMLEECKFDANFDLRELAQRNFAKVED